jgi:predicted nucleic acid-binding protein
MTFIDTNVLLDVVTNNDNWADWSIAQLEAASLNGPLLINDFVYAELSVRYDRVEGLEVFLEEAGLEMTPIPRAALFLAGKVFTHIAGQEDQGLASYPTFSLARMLQLASFRF